MTQQNLIRNDRRLVSQMSPISFGTILKAWRGSKGLDYVLVGINQATKELYAIKHNCINQDGTIHASVTRHKRTFKYTVTPSGQFGIVKGITSVLGQKETVHFDAIDAFNRTISPDISISSFNTISLHTQPLVDRRKSSIYR